MDIEKLAREAGLERAGTSWFSPGNGLDPADVTDAHLRRFAALVVEECAKVCEAESAGHRMAFGEHCANVIRAQVPPQSDPSAR